MNHQVIQAAIDELVRQIGERQDALRHLQAVLGPSLDLQPDHTQPPAPVATKPKPNVKQARGPAREKLKRLTHNGGGRQGQGFTEQVRRAVQQFSKTFLAADVATALGEPMAMKFNWTLRHLVKKGDLVFAHKGHGKDPSIFARPGPVVADRPLAARQVLKGRSNKVNAAVALRQDRQERGEVPGLDAPRRSVAELEKLIAEACAARDKERAADRGNMARVYQDKIDKLQRELDALVGV